MGLLLTIMWVRNEPEAGSLKWYTSERRLLMTLMFFNPVCEERTSRYLPKTVNDGQRRKDGDTQATKQNDLSIPEKKTKRENHSSMSGSRHTVEKKVASVLVWYFHAGFTV